MSLRVTLLQSARACEGAAVALAHSLRHAANSSNASNTILETFREAEAFAITVRAVLDEAAPILPFLCDDARCVGKTAGYVTGGRVKNGFDSIAVVLEALFDAAVDAILEVAGNCQRWLVTPMQKGVGFERMVTHHGQLRALYGLIHLAGKIVSTVDVQQTLFADVGGHGGMKAGKWRAAIRMDDFYGRYFGFHYRPEMRNLLRVVSIARESVRRSHEGEGGGNALMKNVAMLGWGWVYSNMVLMNSLGFGVEGVEQIGAGEGEISIGELRKFMNLVEEPIVSGVSGLASADVAIDRIFEIPGPGEDGGLEGVESRKHSAALREVLISVRGGVKARLMSLKQRPLDLPRSKRWRNEKTSVKRKESGSEKVKRRESWTAGMADGAAREKLSEGVNGSFSERRLTVDGKEPVVSVGLGSLPQVAESSYLASTLKTELIKLQSNVSSFLGLEEAKAASGLIMHFHGGGFVSQSSESHTVYMREWCAELVDAVMLSIDYKLAPEHRFPVAVHECVYAYVWALQNAERLGCKCERVVLTGDSAGGNLAMATALKLGELGLRRADGICVAYPVFYASLAWSPSRLLSFFDPLLPLSVLEVCLRSYLPEKDLEAGKRNALISPLVAGIEELSMLPGVCMVCGSLDPLLDDAVSFLEKLRRAGRKEDVLKVYEAMPHGFLNMNLVNEKAREGMRFLTAAIGRYLGLETKTGELVGTADVTSAGQKSSVQSAWSNAGRPDR